MKALYTDPFVNRIEKIYTLLNTAQFSGSHVVAKYPLRSAELDFRKLNPSFAALTRRADELANDMEKKITKLKAEVARKFSGRGRR
jgi:hypothetical protein